MSFLANSLPFEPETRMTSVWTKSREENDGGDACVTVHLILVGDDQDCDVEATLLVRFLPFHTGGFSGFDRNGKLWIVVIQHTAIDDSSELVRREGPFWTFQNSLERALQHSPSARVMAENRYTRDELLDIYALDGLPTGRAFSWSTAELIYGLLAEMCDVSLEAVVNGYPHQCAFPNIEHACENDVFSDVFSRWILRAINLPKPL